MTDGNSTFSRGKGPAAAQGPGPRCERCGGRGKVQPDSAFDPVACPDCRGDGAVDPYAIKRCPVCRSRMCDHTPAERGGPLEAKLPLIPTVLRLLRRQGARCARCPSVVKPHWGVPVIVGDTIEILCCVCYHQEQR